MRTTYGMGRPHVRESMGQNEDIAFSLVAAVLAADGPGMVKAMQADTATRPRMARRQGARPTAQLPRSDLGQAL